VSARVMGERIGKREEGGGGMPWRRAFVCDVTDSKRAAGCWLAMALFVCVFCVVCVCACAMRYIYLRYTSGVLLWRF